MELDYYPRSILMMSGARRDYISGFRFRHLLSGNNLHSCFCRGVLLSLQRIYSSRLASTMPLSGNRTWHNRYLRGDCSWDSCPLSSSAGSRRRNATISLLGQIVGAEFSFFLVLFPDKLSHYCLADSNAKNTRTRRTCWARSSKGSGSSLSRGYSSIITTSTYKYERNRKWVFHIQKQLGVS